MNGSAAIYSIDFDHLSQSGENHCADIQHYHNDTLAAVDLVSQRENIDQRRYHREYSEIYHAREVDRDWVDCGRNAQNKQEVEDVRADYRVSDMPKAAAMNFAELTTNCPPAIISAMPSRMKSTLFSGDMVLVGSLSTLFFLAAIISIVM